MGGVADQFGAFEGIYHRFAEGRPRELAQVDPVEGHRARVGIGEPPGEPCQGGLAGSGPADHGDGDTGRNEEVEVAQHRLAPVAHRDAAQPQFAASRVVPPGRQHLRPVARARPREQFGGPLCAAAGAAQPADQPDARADADRKHRVLARGDQIARADPVPGELHAGDGDHDDLQRRGDGHRLGSGPRLHPPGGVAVFPQQRKRAEDALSFAGLRAGRGDRVGTGERVEQPGGDGPLGPAVPDADGGGIADQPPQDDGERGEARGEGHDKPGVD
jgi:hypothetical protein